MSEQNNSPAFYRAQAEMLRDVAVRAPPGEHKEALFKIASDYERTFRVLRSLPCDVFLGAHGSYYGMEAKFAKTKAGDRNAFVDPEGYKNYVAEREQTFRTELGKQSQAPSPGP